MPSRKELESHNFADVNYNFKVKKQKFIRLFLVYQVRFIIVYGYISVTDITLSTGISTAILWFHSRGQEICIYFAGEKRRSSVGPIVRKVEKY